MKFWDLEIKCSDDLIILNDLLLDSGHDRGAEVVRWMIEHKKFPYYHVNSDKITHWSWWEGMFESSSWYLDYGTLTTEGQGNRDFHSATQAVWALINAKLYKGHS